MEKMRLFCEEIVTCLLSKEATKRNMELVIELASSSEELKGKLRLTTFLTFLGSLAVFIWAFATMNILPLVMVGISIVMWVKDIICMGFGTWLSYQKWLYKLMFTGKID